MESQEQQVQTQRPMVTKKVTLGPDPPRVTAYGGVVPTRSEVREELRTRLEYGVGKN